MQATVTLKVNVALSVFVILVSVCWGGHAFAQVSVNAHRHSEGCSGAVIKCQVSVTMWPLESTEGCHRCGGFYTMSSYCPGLSGRCFGDGFQFADAVGSR